MIHIGSSNTYYALEGTVKGNDISLGVSILLRELVSSGSDSVDACPGDQNVPAL